MSSKTASKKKTQKKVSKTDEEKFITMIDKTFKNAKSIRDGAKLSKKSLVTYRNDLIRLRKTYIEKYNKGQKNFVNIMIKSPKKVLNALPNGTETDLNMVKAAQTLLRTYGERTKSTKVKTKIEKAIPHYKTYSTTKRHGISEARKKNELTARQKQNWVPFEQLKTEFNKKYNSEYFDNYENDYNKYKNINKDKLERSGKKLFNVYQDAILLSLYLNEEYMPRYDYYNLKIVNHENNLSDEQNYIIIRGDTMKIKLNVFQKIPNNLYKGTTWVVSPKTKHLIKKYLKFKDELTFDNTIKNSSRLLISRRKTAHRIMTPDALKKQLLSGLKGISGKTIGIQLLRNIKSTYIDEYIKKYNLSYAQAEKMHQKLFHTHDEGMKYVKITPKEHKPKKKLSHDLPKDHNVRTNMLKTLLQSIEDKEVTMPIFDELGNLIEWTALF